MDFEIDFLPVGSGEKAGDAIALRYRKDGTAPFKVMVVDGGTQESGEALVEHIRSVYGAHSVDDVVLTHPDTDHASGLRAVLESLHVRRLWLHGVWHHTQEMLHLFASNRWTAQGLEDAIRREYTVIEELLDLAGQQGTEVYEPWAGTQIGPVRVLSPSRAAYLHLVPQFRKTPDPDEAELKRVGMWLNPKKGLRLVLEALQHAFDSRAEANETWESELLREGGLTAAENESSVVMYGMFGRSGVLLTGDAGCNGLTWAMDTADAHGLDLRTAALVQVPHHGSRRNVSSSVLNRLLGPPLPRGSAEIRRAIVSAPEDDTKHPRRIVMNAFLRRGAGVRTTQGNTYWFRGGDVPAR